MRRMLGALLVAGAVLAAAYGLRLNQAEQVVIPVKRANETAVVKAGEVITQRLVLPPGEYSGVVLYGKSVAVRGQPVRVRVLDKSGEELAKGNWAQIDYPPEAGESLRLSVSTNRWQLKEPGHVFIEVEVVADELPLKLVDGLYGFGEIGGAIDRPESDLVVSLLTPSWLAVGAQQGVLAGVIFMLGLVLVSRLRSENKRFVAAAIWLAVITPVALAGYWWSPDRLGIADWDYYFSLHHAYRQIILQHGQFPWWNPYTCGGTAGLGDPEFPGLTLTFLLELLFGIEAGLRLAIYLSVMVGSWGILALARRLNISVWGGVVAALAVAFGTVSLLEITEGHVNVLAAMWVPWVFWSWYTAYGREKYKLQTSTNIKNIWTGVCGIFLAITFYQGGIYLLMYMGLVFLALTLFATRPGVAAMVTLKATAWAMGLAAFKLVPVLLWLKQFPDDAYAQSAYTLPWLGEILGGRHLHGAYIIPGQNSGWHEYGAYVGYIVFGLALLALTKIKQRRVQILLIGVIAAGLLSALGPHLAALFDLLWWFPRSNISRIILLAVIGLGLLAGIGIDVVRRRFSAGVVIIIAGLVAVDIFSLSYQLSEQAFVLPIVVSQIRPAPEPIAHTALRYDQAGEGSRTTRAYEAARVGWGTAVYCSVLGPGAHVRTAEDESGDEILAAAHSQIDYEIISWSPREVRIRVRAKEADTVTLNANYAQGWTINGDPAEEIGGLVGFDLPAGEHDLIFRYDAPGWKWGAGVSLLTLLGLTWRWNKFKVLLK